MQSFLDLSSVDLPSNISSGISTLGEKDKLCDVISCLHEMEIEEGNAMLGESVVEEFDSLVRALLELESEFADVEIEGSILKELDADDELDGK